MIGLSNTIACIGWGSLVWDAGALPIASDWYSDGPPLPLEFARLSRNGRLTLVLVPSAPLVTTCWATLQVPNLDAAREALRRREGTVLSEIGHWPSASSNEFVDGIGAWAAGKSLQGVVWTSLPPKFGGQSGKIPTLEEALAYLSGLKGDTRAAAEQYIRMAPPSIRTPYRLAFESELGWQS